MKPEELEQLWREIGDDIDRDDALDLGQYLHARGVSEHQSLESLNVNMKNLVSDAFGAQTLNNDQLDSKYKIIKQIDSGGQSDIYLAERSDGVYQQTVVIKFISGQFDQQALKQQFLQEMQLLADLKHPGVVTIIDGNITPAGQPWLVLEYINGPHIDHYVQQKQLTTEAVVGLMMGLCETLQFVHQRQVLHKDLKPSNVLVKQINQVPYPVLIDFGIAIQSGQQPAQTFGTRGYSAPEQIKGHKVDQRTDLYALGRLFSHLLLVQSGAVSALPSAETSPKVLRQAGVDKDLGKIITKLTAHDAGKRYDTADALRADLNQWQQGFPLSVDNHRVSTVMAKTIKRHPWVTLGMMLALVLAVLFTVKYTRDTQHLQQLTVAEKNATDELMNFMLDDMYENLDRIGRIDVLRTVAEKSVAHLQSQDPLTLDVAGREQAVKAYVNAGRVFDALEQTGQAQRMFRLADEHLSASGLMSKDPLSYHQLLAHLRVYQSLVLSSAGQEQVTEQVLSEAIRSMQQVLQLNPEANPWYLWKAHLELGYHLMEYARPDEAYEHIDQTINITQQQLLEGPVDFEWLYRQSHSLQLKAWYEIDFGELTTGIEDVQQAIVAAQKSIDLDPEDLKKQNNLRILHNQLAYFFLENGQIEEAKTIVLRAIELGEQLKLKAPFNQQYQREHVFSLTTAGEVLQQQGQLSQALTYFQQSLNFSEATYAKDPGNYSAANDLAIDYLLVADLMLQQQQPDQAQELFVKAEALMQPIFAAEPNNKYYAHTLLVVKLHLKKFAEAKPLFTQTQANEMVDGSIETLLKKHQLNDWLP